MCAIFNEFYLFIIFIIFYFYFYNNLKNKNKIKKFLNGSYKSIDKSTTLFSNVFRIGPVIESEKLPVHGSLVGPMVEPVM